MAATNPIYAELNISALKDLLTVLDSSKKEDNKMIIIKFGAPWCGPCQKIKTVCYQKFRNFSNSVICFDLNVDDNLELYVAYKAKKMVPSIPTILAYVNKPNRDKESWYAPDISVIGSQQHQIDHFFKEVEKHLI